MWTLQHKAAHKVFSHAWQCGFRADSGDQNGRKEAVSVELEIKLLLRAKLLQMCARKYKQPVLAFTGKCNVQEPTLNSLSIGRHTIPRLEDGLWGLWSRWEWIHFHIHIHSSILMLLFPTISMPPQLLACRKKSRMKSPLNNRVTTALPAGTRGQCQVYMQGLGYTRENLQVYQVWCHCSYDVAASFRTCCRITMEKWHFNTQIIALLCLLELEKYLLLRRVFVDTNQ